MIFVTLFDDGDDVGMSPSFANWGSPGSVAEGYAVFEQLCSCTA